MLDCLAVGFGGFLGAVCRYLVGLIPINEKFAFPARTFAVNVVGSFVIGMVAALAMKQECLGPRAALFLKAGLCGGFTTFSSFALETGTLVREGNIGTAAGYAVLSMAAGVAAVYAGEAVVK